MEQLQLPIDLKDHPLEKQILTWDEVDKDIKNLIKQIQDYLSKKQIDASFVTLLIPCRGGEIIGSLIKNALGLTEEQVFRVKISNKKYEEEGAEGIRTIYSDMITLGRIKERDGIVLFVDDLVDSGDTISFIESLYTNLLTAVLYRKKSTKKKVDLFTRELDDRWIHFPWENFYKK